jgi:O-antigen ligase
MQPKADYNFSSVDGRKALLERGIGYMAEYPVFGLGISNFPRAECTISPKLARLSKTGPIRCKAPHNSYIQAGAETGVPGLVVWASIIVGGIVAMLRLRRRLPRSWRWGTGAERFLYGAPTFFALALIGFAVTSFFVSFAWMDPLYLMAAFMSGLYIALRRQAAQMGDYPETDALLSPPGLAPGSARWRTARSAHRFAAAMLPVPAE